ncbi:MAG: hypothetical protein R3C99_26665 [Pirellulaceae bacterium]
MTAIQTVIGIPTATGMEILIQPVAIAEFAAETAIAIDRDCDGELLLEHCDAALTERLRCCASFCILPQPGQLLLLLLLLLFSLGRSQLLLLLTIHLFAGGRLRIREFQNLSQVFPSLDQLGAPPLPR